MFIRIEKYLTLYKTNFNASYSGWLDLPTSHEPLEGIRFTKVGPYPIRVLDQRSKRKKIRKVTPGMLGSKITEREMRKILHR